MTDLPWGWFLMRSGGLVAAGLLTVAVLVAVLGPLLRPTARLTAVSVHRAAAVTGSLLIVAHVVLAVLDAWIPLDWPAALLPGLAGWQRWGVGLGALALDLLVVVLLTTALRYRGPGLWRRAHLLAYPVWALAIGHGLLVGSDGRAMSLLARVSVAVVLLAVAARLLLLPGAGWGTPRARAASPVVADLPARRIGAGR